ncbi:MAG: GNAT family N-acetyltransferase [Alphaproteobacteria bacterium]|nr:GNAT family N-acetyltransferase [Thalassospira sp.]MCE2964378.1 GNAT family N-acetyltransferase [Alphaproteobacteria bacterium]
MALINMPKTSFNKDDAYLFIKHIQQLQPLYFNKAWDADYLYTLIASPLTTLDVSRETLAIQGYCLCQQLANDTAEILQILVLPHRRGQGAARSLLQQTATACRTLGITTVYLEAALSNTAALRLYAQLGAVETGRRQHYYSGAMGDASTAVTLTWFL